MNTRDVSIDFAAILLILTVPFIEFVYTNSFVFEFVNVVILAGYAVVAIASAGLINKYPNRLFRAVIWTTAILLFLDVRVEIDAIALVP